MTDFVKFQIISKLQVIISSAPNIHKNKTFWRLNDLKYLDLCGQLMILFTDNTMYSLIN